MRKPHPLPPLIGFAGVAGAGKDTAAKFLGVYGYRPFSFSDALYREVADAFSVTMESLYYRALKDAPQLELALARCRDDGFICALLEAGEIATQPAEYEKPRSPRWILQRWGTEYRRKQNPQYWIERVAEDYRRRGPLMANTSVRFQNEAEWILSERGLIFRILNDSAGCEAHVSENRLPDEMIAGEIDNNGTFEELFENIQIALDRA
ncbi:MAG TPA: hypothetical protein VFL54_04525 [Gammaproteobacteria bacterium]|nr:hypothetical protein [Gammaproteobacteria bacterium]